MASKTILVTGGAGFIGSYVVEKLLARQDKVVVLDDFNDFYNPQQKRTNIETYLSNKNLFLVEGDIRKNRLLNNLFSRYKFDSVIHLAARAGIQPSLTKPRIYWDVNVMGTQHLLEVMRKFRVNKLTFASSSSIYGNRSKGPFKESDITDSQISPYGASKKSAELLCAVYANLYGIDTTVLRFFTAFGPRNRPDMAAYKFVRAVFCGEELTQYGDGTTGRDYTFVEDVAEAVVLADGKKLGYEVLNIGNSKPVLLKDLIKTVEQVLCKQAKVKKLPAQKGDVDLTFADTSKAQKLLGWQPRTSLKQGLKKLADWFKSSGHQ